MNEIIPDIFLRGCRKNEYLKTNRIKEAFIPSQIRRKDGDFDISTNHLDKKNESILILAKQDSSQFDVFYGRASELIGTLKGFKVSDFDKPHLPEIMDSLLTELIHFEDPKNDIIEIVPGNPYHWSLIFSAKLTTNPNDSGKFNQALLRAIANKMVQGTDIQIIDRNTLDMLIENPEMDIHIDFVTS